MLNIHKGGGGGSSNCVKHRFDVTFAPLNLPAQYMHKDSLLSGFAHRDMDTIGTPAKNVLMCPPPNKMNGFRTGSMFFSAANSNNLCLETLFSVNTRVPLLQLAAIASLTSVKAERPMINNTAFLDIDVARIDFLPFLLI